MYMQQTIGAEVYGHLKDSARYQATTLVGNWNEEREFRRSMMRDLLVKKETGSLRLDAYSQKMSIALQEVELTKVEDDPYIHFGDVLQLVHLETGSVLSSDVTDRDQRPGEEACAATGAADARAPCARNTFVIVKYQPPRNSPLEPDWGDNNIVRYGQKIRLALNPLAYGAQPDAEGGSRPLCLFSRPVSPTHCAKYCRNQIVGFTFRNTYDTVWTITTPDPNLRTASEGVEVMAGAPLLLMHVQTQKALLLESQRYPNDFGTEWELSARNATTEGLKLALENSAKGLLKGTIPKSGKEDNLWVFMTGSRVAPLPAAQKADEVASSALSMLVKELVGNGGFSLLEKKIVTHSNHASELHVDDLLLLIRQSGGSSVSNSEVGAMAAKYLTPNKPGVVDAGELLRALRGEAQLSVTR